MSRKNDENDLLFPMNKSVSKSSSIVSWNDPDGGVIDFLSYLPTVKGPKFRNIRRKWDGLALLDDDTVIEAWAAENELESRSKGANAMALIASGGNLGFCINALLTIEGIEAGNFPDPVPYSLWNLFQTKSRFFIEPFDEQWENWLLRKADRMVKFRTLLASIGSGRRFRKHLQKLQKSVVEKTHSTGYPSLAIAAVETWWNLNERTIGEELILERDNRFSARMRGALNCLKELKLEKTQDVRLLVISNFQWIQNLIVSLNTLPKPEKVEPYMKD